MSTFVRSLPFRLSLIVMLACHAFSNSPAQAITVSMNYGGGSPPPFDPDGSKLKAIVAAAGAIWGDYILDDQNYSFDLRWEDIDGNTLGQHQPGWLLDSRDLVFDTKDSKGAWRDWFFDPTPFDNSEFSMQSTLVRDLNPQDADDAYAGQPPALLEAGYSGPAISAAAVGKHDLLSAVLHEMGHMLGYNFNPLDDDYDFSSATIGGLNVGVNESDGYHGGVRQSLMFGSINTNIRRLPSATDILGTWDESTVAVPDGHGGYAFRSFQSFDVPRVDFLGTHSTGWNDTLNWVGGAVPDLDNEVFIRNGGRVVQPTGNSSAKTLLVSEESALFVQGRKLDVQGDTQLGNIYARRGELHVGNVSGTFSNFQTDNLQLATGLVNTMTPQSSIDVNRDFSIGPQGTLMGAGTVRVGGTLTNNGQINGGTFLLFGFGGTLTLGTSGVGAKLDLDGSGLEGGRISATTGNLAVYGPLADDFNGFAAIGAERTMSFSQPWKMVGDLTMRGGGDTAHLATLSGAEVTLGGNIDVDGQSLITAPVILNSPAVVNLPDANDLLILGGVSTLRGGTFVGNGTLGIQGNVNLAMPNPTVGEFPDVAESFRMSAFTFAGTTGSESVNLGDAGVLDPTVYDPPITPTPNPTIGTFTTYGFQVPVQVRSGGVLNASVSSAYLPKQTTMSGGRITGSATVNQVGDLVVDQNSRIDPNTFLWGVDATHHHTTIRSGKTLDLSPRRISRSDSDQVYQGQVLLEPGASLSVELEVSDRWTNAGKLQMATASAVLGDNVVNTGEVSGNGYFFVDRFENSGHLAPGRIFGGIQMPTTDFVQSSTGVLDMSLGNSVIGNGSSLLSTDTAELDGTLALFFTSGFSPAPGSEIDLITGNSISGQFSNILLNGPFGSSLLGEVLYGTNKVSFLVDQALLGGDFSSDGVVDRTDLEIWQKGYGGDPLQRVSTGADGKDFLAWQRGYTNTKLSSRLFLAAVPEPSTLLLGLLGVVGMFSRRK